MSLKRNGAWTRAKCRREFVRAETFRLLQQEGNALAAQWWEDVGKGVG